ncbi:hypothetical protein SCLCIDRAFT_26681, partial [Scleroderma citrinum Foug A]
MATHDTDPLIGWQANYAGLHPAAFNAIEDALRAELGLSQLQEVGPAMRPLTPPDDHMHILQEIEPEQMPQDTILELQDVIIPWNTDEAMVDEAASMQMVMNMGSTIDQCPGWKIIFLDVFREYCSWIATVSATSPPLFQDLTELLSNIPSENHMGVLTNFTRPFPPDVVQYVWTGTGWDSHLAYPIFHLFEADQNGLEVKWFNNPFVKSYVRAATNPHSRGWFGVTMYSQRGDGTGFWQGVSQPNVDFAAWILSWFIVDLTADILGDHTWNKYTVTSARLKASAQKCANPSVLELGPCKKLSTQDPLVHHGCHFGRAICSFCSMHTLLTNGIESMAEELDLGSLSAIDQKELEVFHELLRMVSGLEARLMTSSEDEVVQIADLIQKGINGACADDTKGMKSAVVDWITPKGQSLNPHILRNAKAGRGFNHECTGALLCPARLDWNNVEMQAKLMNGQIQVVGDQWPVFLYSDYVFFDLITILLQPNCRIQAFKHVFTSPSSMEQEPKVTRSGNARLHGMRSITKASIVYVATQVCFALTSTQVFSCTDLVTDSERFYNSITELLDETDEKDEVDQLLTWWN